MQLHFINIGWMSRAITATVRDTHTPHFFPPRLLELARRSPRALSDCDTQLAGDQPFHNLSMSNYCQNGLPSCGLPCTTSKFLASWPFLCLDPSFLRSHLYMCPSAPFQRCPDKLMPCGRACHTSCRSHFCTSNPFGDGFDFRRPDSFTMSLHQRPSVAVTDC